MRRTQLKSLNSRPGQTARLCPPSPDAQGSSLPLPARRRRRTRKCTITRLVPRSGNRREGAPRERDAQLTRVGYHPGELIFADSSGSPPPDPSLYSRGAQTEGKVDIFIAGARLACAAPRRPPRRFGWLHARLPAGHRATAKPPTRAGPPTPPPRRGHRRHPRGRRPLPEGEEPEHQGARELPEKKPPPSAAAEITPRRALPARRRPACGGRGRSPSTPPRRLVRRSPTGDRRRAQGEPRPLRGQARPPPHPGEQAFAQRDRAPRSSVRLTAAARALSFPLGHRRGLRPARL